MYEQHRTCKNLNKKEPKLKDRICTRKVSEVSYENKVIPRTYWKGKIKKIEQPVILPHDRRKQYVQKIIPEDVFSAVSNVLNFENEDITDIQQRSSLNEPEKLERDTETVKSKRESLELQIPEDELLTEHKSKVNPFINFLKKSPEDANIWLPKKPPDFRVKPLIEKSAIITHNIINDFVEWLNTLGPINSDISLNEKTLQKMFRIGINEFAIKSLCIDVKELGSVPSAVANATHNPEKSTRKVLQANLARDIKAEKLKKPNTHAFGSALPVELQKFPPHNNTYNRWIKCSIPTELKTMECVFKDITEINSVKAYCQWLIDHPKLPRPQYLVDKGLLNPKYWKQTMSIDTRELEAFIAATLHKEFSTLDDHSKKSITFERDSVSMI